MEIFLCYIKLPYELSWNTSKSRTKIGFKKQTKYIYEWTKNTYIKNNYKCSKPWSNLSCRFLDCRPLLWYSSSPFSLYFTMKVGTHPLISHILTEFHGLPRKYWINIAQIHQNTHAFDKTDLLLKRKIIVILRRFSIFNRCRLTPVKTPLAGYAHEADFGNCCPYLSERHTHQHPTTKAKPTGIFFHFFLRWVLDGNHTPHSWTDLLIPVLQVLSW